MTFDPYVVMRGKEKEYSEFFAVVDIGVGRGTTGWSPGSAAC